MPVSGYMRIWFFFSVIYDENMNFLYDTHHGTVLSAFSSISWPKTEMKTCRFGDISDSYMRSTSFRQFFVIRFCCGEIMFFNK